MLQHSSDAFLLITFLWLWLSLLVLSLKKLITSKDPRRTRSIGEQLQVTNEMFTSEKFKRERAWVSYALMWFSIALMIWIGVSLTNAALA